MSSRHGWPGRAAALLGATLLTSCAALRPGPPSVEELRFYPGEERPADRVALLFAPGVEVSALNGGELGEEVQAALRNAPGAAARDGTAAHLALLPGRHTVLLTTAVTATSRTAKVLAFQARAGRRYEVRWLSRGPIIVDLGTMEEVGTALPAPALREGMGYALPEKDGNLGFLGCDQFPSWKATWKLPGSGTLTGCTLDVARFGRALAEDYRWSVNALGHVLRDQDRFVAYQHVKLQVESWTGDRSPAEVFIGKGPPVVRSWTRLYVPDPLGGETLVDLCNAKPPQLDALTGMARAMARSCAAQAEPEAFRSSFRFATADGPFFAVLTFRDRGGKERTLVYGEEE
jgi:hypothetical protein